MERSADSHNIGCILPEVSELTGSCPFPLHSCESFNLQELGIVRVLSFACISYSRACSLVGGQLMGSGLRWAQLASDPRSAVCSLTSRHVFCRAKGLLKVTALVSN